MRRAAWLPVLAALAALAGRPASGQEPRSPSLEEAPVNYAFAAFLGSGIYKISGRTIQIYTIPLSASLVSASDERTGVSLMLPVTLGLFDFQPDDIFETGLPDGVNTLSFVPGVELRIPLGHGWTLFPWAQAGAAADLTDDQLTWVFAAGARARWEKQLARHWLSTEAKLFYAGNVQEGFGSYDDYGELDLGIEVRDPLGVCVGEAEVDLGYFFIAYFYTQDMSFLRAPGTRLGFSNQFEAGFTVGTVRPLRVWGIALPRLGASYRFGEGVPSLRVVIGAPF